MAQGAGKRVATFVESKDWLIITRVLIESNFGMHLFVCKSYCWYVHIKYRTIKSDMASMKLDLINFE